MIENSSRDKRSLAEKLRICAQIALLALEAALGALLGDQFDEKAPDQRGERSIPLWSLGPRSPAGSSTPHADPARRASALRYRPKAPIKPITQWISYVSFLIA